MIAPRNAEAMPRALSTSRVSLLRVLAGIVAILCAGLAWHPTAVGAMPVWVPFVTILAIAGASFSFPALEWRQNSAAPPAASEPVPHLPMLLFTLPALIAVALWSREPFQVNHSFVRASSTWGAYLWLGGMLAGLAVLARDRIRTARQASGQPYDRERPHPAVWLVLVAVVAFSAALRFWHLGLVPEGIWSDEVDSANDAVRMLHAPFQPFAPGNFGHNPSLYFYAMAGLIAVWGNTIEVVRATSALFGISAVVVVFFLGLRARSAALGLIAAMLMASAPWALTFSRVGMPNIPIPAVTGLGYLFFILAMQRPLGLWFALSGCWLGLSLDTYPGAYLPALVPVLIVFGRAAGDPVFARSSRRTKILLPLCLVVAAAPTLTALFLDGSYVLGRIHVTSLLTEYSGVSDRLSALAHNLRAYLFMFTVDGDHNGRHNLVAAPMLDPVAGPLFLLGLGMCMRRWRHWLTLTLLLWFGSNLLSGILSVDYEAPHGARTLGVLAPVLIIAGLPLCAIPDVARSLGSVIRARYGAETRELARQGLGTWVAVGACMCLLLGTATAYGVHRYFVVQARDLRSWHAMTGDLAIAGRAIERLTGTGYVVLADPRYSIDMVVRYTAPDWKPASYGGRHPDAGRPAGKPEALIIPVDQVELMRRLSSNGSWHVSSIGPAYDHRITAAFVLTRE